MEDECYVILTMPSGMLKVGKRNRVRERGR